MRPALNRRSLFGVLTLTLGILLAVAPKAQTVQATDYGVTPDSTVDNTPALQAALDAAVAQRQRGQWAVVQLPAGVIGYRGVLKIDADSLEIRGVGGAVLTRDTVRVGDNAGTAYYPVRRLDRVRPGAPVTVVQVLPGSFEPDDRGRIDATRWIVWNKAQAGTALRLRFRDFIMDGNLSANLPAVQAMPRDPGKAYVTFLQDGTGYAGLVANGHDRTQLCSDGDRIIELGQGRRPIRQQGNQVGTLIDLENVVVTGYPSGDLIANKCTRWRLRDVRLADSPVNHLAYNAEGGIDWQDQDDVFDMGDLSGWGGWENVTLAGASWSAVVSQAGLLARNVVVEEVTPNPTYRPNTHVFGVRWGEVRLEGYTDAADDALRLWKSDGGTLRLNADADVTPPDSALTLPLPARPPGEPGPPPAPDPTPPAPEPTPPQPPREPAPDPEPDPEPAPEPEPTDPDGDLAALRDQIDALSAALDDVADRLATAEADAEAYRQQAEAAESASAALTLALAETEAARETDRAALADAAESARLQAAELAATTADRDRVTADRDELRARLAGVADSLRAALAVASGDPQPPR